MLFSFVFSFYPCDRSIIEQMSVIKKDTPLSRIRLLQLVMVINKRPEVKTTTIDGCHVHTSPYARSCFKSPIVRPIAPIAFPHPPTPFRFNYRKIGWRENNQSGGESLSGGQIAWHSSADSRLIVALCQDQLLPLPVRGWERGLNQNTRLD